MQRLGFACQWMERTDLEHCLHSTKFCVKSLLGSFPSSQLEIKEEEIWEMFLSQQKETLESLQNVNCQWCIIGSQY